MKELATIHTAYGTNDVVVHMSEVDNTKLHAKSQYLDNLQLPSGQRIRTLYTLSDMVGKVVNIRGIIKKVWNFCPGN